MKFVKPVFAALLCIASVPASAGTVLFDDFDSENGGATALNYAGFANWDSQPVALTGQPGATVDIIDGGSNPYGITCSGICVDLDGSSGVGGLISTKSFFAFSANDRVTLSVDISGNQRVGAENYVLAFLIPGVVDIFDFTISDPFTSFNFGDQLGFTGTLLTGDVIPFDRPFGRYSLSFRAGSGGVFGAGIGTDSADNFGPIIDNVRIDVTAVPEPATWAMMIFGFGMIGGAMRRRPALKPAAA